MQTHQRKGAMASWLAGGALLLLAALALSGTQAPTRAQDAPEEEEETPSLPAMYGLPFWEDYLHGDSAAAYDKITKLLASKNSLTHDEHRVALALQRNLAAELGDVGQLRRDLGETTSKLKENQCSAARFEYSQALRRSGLNIEADEQAAKLEFVTDWWICGPFPNERGQGFDEALDPERNLTVNTVYSGKDGQPCTFRRLPASPVDGVIDLGAMCRPNSEAVAYLVTAIYLDTEPTKDQSEANAWVSVGSDGPFRVFLGASNVDKDERVVAGGPVSGVAVESEAERPFGFDQNDSWVGWRNADHTRLGGSNVFTKGWNLILIKAGISEGSWRIRVRAGSTPEGKFAKSLDDVSAAIAACNKKDPLGYLQSPVRNGQLGEALLEIFSPTLDRSDGTARRILFSDKNVAANARAFMTFLQAEASKSQSRVASGKEENKRRELLEQVLKLDPKAARAALELAKYYSGTFRNPTEADRYAQMAVTLAPKWVEARVFAARVATMKGLDGEVERELASLLKEYPDHPSVLRFAGYYRGVHGDYKGSDELFKHCLYKGDFTDDYCRERLFSRAVERNDTDAALQYANETRQLNPFDLASSEGLIKLFLATGSLERAMAECERALNICPREDNFLARKGEILLRMAAREPAKAADFKAKSIAAYREALKCNPNREDLARYLEFLADEKPAWEVKLQENIEARIEAALKLPVDGNDAYRIIYRDEITVVNDDGTKSIFSQFAYRICNDDGREGLQNLGAPAYEDQIGRCVGARVYHADGSTEEGRRVDSQAMLPPLNVGDVVAVRYRVSDTAQSFFGDFFGASETLGDYVPVDEARLVYVLPKSRKFYEYVQHGASPAVKREDGDKAIWTYTAKALARVPREGMQLPLEQIVPTVQLSTYENWKDFGRWYFNLIKKQLEPTPEMKAKVAELTAGKTSERDKTRSIYTWVVTNVRYNSDWHFGVHGYKPFSAGAIFERCIGDCKDKAIVMCTMLAIAGVKAYPVLIRLADSGDPRGREDITLPMPHHFNHAIAYVEYADGKGQFLDGTATYNGFDELPGADAGANVVIIKPEGGVQTQVPIPPAEQNSTREDISLEFLGNGKLKLSVKLTAKGDRASYLRAIYLQPGTRATQLEAQWARHKAGAKVVKVEANDLANIDLPPEIKYEVELPDAYTTDAQGNIELAVALNPLLFGKGIAAASTRRTDIAQGAPYQWESVLTFKIPEGMEVEKLPGSYLCDEKTSMLSVIVQQIDNTLSISRTYAGNGGVIEAKEYSKLRENMLAFDRAEAAKLKLVKEK